MFYFSLLLTKNFQMLSPSWWRQTLLTFSFRILLLLIMSTKYSLDRWSLNTIIVQRHDSSSWKPRRNVERNFLNCKFVLLFPMKALQFQSNIYWKRGKRRKIEYFGTCMNFVCEVNFWPIKCDLMLPPGLMIPKAPAAWTRQLSWTVLFVVHQMSALRNFLVNWTTWTDSDSFNGRKSERS